MNSAFPLVQLDTTPPAEPASSPVLWEKLLPCSMTGQPSASVFLLPWAVSLDWAMLGYGIGMGPAGLGVLHTSGKAMAIPLLF